MNEAQWDFTLTGAAPSQEDLILDILQARAGREVGLPELMAKSGSAAVHSRIANLRKRGCQIVNRTERHPSGKRMSFYTLLAP